MLVYLRKNRCSIPILFYSVFIKENGFRMIVRNPFFLLILFTLTILGKGVLLCFEILFNGAPEWLFYPYLR